MALVHQITVHPYPDEPWDVGVSLHKEKAIVRLGERVTLVADARDTLAALCDAAETLGDLIAESLAEVDG